MSGRAEGLSPVFEDDFEGPDLVVLWCADDHAVPELVVDYLRAYSR